MKAYLFLERLLPLKTQSRRGALDICQESRPEVALI